MKLFLNCNWKAQGYSSKGEFLKAIAKQNETSERSIQRWVSTWKQRENMNDLADELPGPMPGTGAVLDADMRAHLHDCYLIRNLNPGQCYRSLINYLKEKQNSPGCRVAHLYRIPSRATVERFLHSLDVRLTRPRAKARTRSRPPAATSTAHIATWPRSNVWSPMSANSTCSPTIPIGP